MTPMPEFEVSVAPEGFGRTGAGTVTGPVWARVAGTDFPEPGWPDLPVAVLGGWLAILAGLESGEPAPAVLSFMEGPYELEVARDPGDRWLLRARKDDADVIAETTADTLADLRDPVRTAAVQTLAACRVRGWAGPDVRHLARLTG